MCFTIPYKVKTVTGGTALLENNQVVTLGAEISVQSGDYVQIVGDIAVGKLSAREGLRIRKLIKELNAYETP